MANQQIDNHLQTFDIDEPITESFFAETEPKLKAFTHSSSWIGNVRYDSEEKTMRVLMNGKAYNHCGVEQIDYDGFEGSPSKGEHWWRNIKDQFNCSGVKEATNNAEDMDWPPDKLSMPDQVDCLMMNYSPDTGRPDGITPDEKEVQTQPYPTDKPYTYPEINESIVSNTTACGNCRFYVDGGACALVKGAIEPIRGICKFYEGGDPLPYTTQVFPIYEQVEAEYQVQSSEPYLKETIAKNIIDREHELLADGVPENEVHDILQKEFSDTSIADEINETVPDDTNYVATGAKINSEPSMHGEHGHQVTNPTVMDYKNENPDPDALVYDIPPIYDKPTQEATKLLHRYIHVKHFRDSFCKTFAGKMFDLDSESFRPIPPSESYEYYNTGQFDCKCYWIAIQNTKPDKLEFDNAIAVPEELADLPRPRDEVTGRFVKEAMMIRETIGELQAQFNWMTPDYLQRVSEMGRNVAGKFVLVRASAEAITDHRSEGEPYRRLLKGDELAQLTRTGIGKSTDINHLGKEYEVDSDVLDAEYDPLRKETQMMVHLRDPEVIHFIETGQINTVSINAGRPRHMPTECDTGECFVVPRGLVLGELDGIAFTWVVNDPNGIVWRGKYIAPATPGVKSTKLELI